MRRAVDYARKRKGPALVHAHVIRPYSHSLSDDEILYRPPEQREEEARRDPLNAFPQWLVPERHATEEGIRSIPARVDPEGQAATAGALSPGQPGPDTG